MRVHIEAVDSSRWAKRSHKTRKIIIISMILVLIIALMVTAYYFLIELPKEKQNIIINEQIQKEELKEEENPVTEEPQTVQSQYIPLMTEEGMYKIQHIYAVEEDEGKRVFLTFDDGPSRDDTVPILDLLKEKDIKATFFVLGNRVEEYPEIVKREYEEGHYIANHGYSHVYSQIYESASTVIDEYDRTNTAIAKALGIEGYQTYLFRFPGGSGGWYNDVKTEAKKIFEERNIAYVDWNALTRDSEGKFTKDELFENLKSTIGTQKSLVILCHDAAGKTSTYEALPEIIDYLKNEGYVFANMRDLVK